MSRRQERLRVVQLGSTAAVASKQEAWLHSSYRQCASRHAAQMLACLCSGQRQGRMGSAEQGSAAAGAGNQEGRAGSRAGAPAAAALGRKGERHAHRDGQALFPAANSCYHRPMACAGGLRHLPSCLCNFSLCTKEQHEFTSRRAMRLCSAGVHGPAPRSRGADAVHR